MPVSPSHPAPALLTTAAFENPLAMARGQTQIADIFCLLDLLPGSRWSELGDVAEAESYGAYRPTRRR